MGVQWLDGKRVIAIRLKTPMVFEIGAPACEMMYHVVVFKLSILKDVCFSCLL